MWQTRGQDPIINFLKECITRKAVSHAYLFVGLPQVGKMTLAIDLARALNCTSAAAPCGTCRTCQRIAEGKHADVVIISKTTGRDARDRKKSTEIGIDTVREFLQKNCNLPPYEGKAKVYIIDDAELMSVEAANCILKTLEEPPSHVVIILLTTQENLLLPTVVSRCQRFELKPMALNETETLISTQQGFSQEQSKLLARLSRGCAGWALSAMENENLLKGRDQRLGEFSTLLTCNWDERFSYIQRLPSDRVELEEVFKVWLSYCRDVLLIKYNCDEAIVNMDRRNDIKSWSNMLTITEIKDFVDNINEALTCLSVNANLHLLLETLMLDMPKKEKRGDYMVNSSPTIN